MTFREWIFSNYTNPSINGQWKPLHIITLCLSIAIIVIISIFCNKNSKRRKIALYTLVSIILFFEISRRVINVIKGNVTDFDSFMYCFLPRPWCAISCWLLIISPLVNKKFFYNFASMSSLLCAIIFFAYPGAGFNNKYILFENLYSISTHALLLITSIVLICLKFTDFKYHKGIYKEIIILLCVFAYAFIEIFLLKVESDPLYFMKGNDVQEILGFSYGLFLVVYVIFLAIYFNAFYVIQKLCKSKSK